MAKITINGTQLKVKNGTTILKAAESLGYKIPTLCFMEEINEIGFCRICVVEVKGRGALAPSCAEVVYEGMEVRTDSVKALNARRNNLELLLSNHPFECLVCTKNLDCELQGLAEELNIREIHAKGEKTPAEMKQEGKEVVTKAVDEELKQATFIVMVPEEVDAHGDVTSEAEVRKACHNFNKYSMKANLFHLVETDTFEFCESYCCPSDFVLGDKFVRKGTWLATIQSLDDSLWELIKSGEINGLSIGALASVESIEEDE